MRSRRQRSDARKRNKNRPPFPGRCGGMGGKIKYGNKEAAESEIRYRQALHLHGKVPVRTYKCPKCHKWHLTSMEKYTDGHSHE